MPVRISLLCLMVSLLVPIHSAFADGAAFSVRPNTVTAQSAGFGFGVGEQSYLMAGLQFVMGGVEVDYSEGRADEEDGSLWVPSLGLKHYLSRPEAQTVRPYLFGSVFTIIPSYDGSRDVEEVVEDFWSFGLSAAFGCEYFFHSQFSLGGEFGANALWAFYDDDDGTDLTVDIEATYAAVTLNFLL